MDFEAARPEPDDPLLRYSLAEFDEIIFAAFEIAGVTSVLEIGSEAGLFTERLSAWVAERGGELVSIDPHPSEKVRDLAARIPAMTVVQDLSLNVLPHLEAKDAYLIDGDHNYFTVAGELAAIAAAAERASVQPLLFVQDVAWPTGARDMYYDPESLPEEGRHPYDFAGVVPWDRDTRTQGGFRGNGEFAYARTEGGERNGVRTALVDFLAAHPGFDVISVPCVFGLAVVYPRDAPWAGQLSARLGWYDDNPLLATLEANRILLYLKVLELQDRLAAERRHRARLVSQLEAQLETARTEAAVAEQVARQAVQERQDAAVAAPVDQTGRPGAAARSGLRSTLARGLRRAP